MQFLEWKDIREIVDFFPENEQRLEAHKSGTLDGNIWNSAFKKSYAEDEWEIKGTELFSKYELKVYDTSALYYRTVEVNGKPEVSVLSIKYERGEKLKRRNP